MRILKTTKPIPVRYLKSGQDHGSYDMERLLWLPGRSTPVRRAAPDLAGLKRKGVAYGSAPPQRKGTGLLIPVHKPYKPQPLVIATR